MQLLEEPAVVIDLIAVEEEEAKKLLNSLLVTVLDRCSSEPVISDKDWERLEQLLTEWILEHKNRQAPRFEKLEDRYKGHRILKCFDLDTKTTLQEIIVWCNSSWKGATFEVVSKDEIPKKGPPFTLREINKALIQARTIILRYKRQNPKNMEFYDYCEVSKAWETIDRYEVLEEKLTLYKEAGVEENPRKHPRPSLPKIELNDKQLDAVVDYYPKTKRVISLMDFFKRKRKLTDSDYDTWKFGAEWLLPYKQRILDKEKKANEKKSSKTDEKKSSKADDKKKSSSSSTSSRQDRNSSDKKSRRERARSPLKRDRSPSKRERSPSRNSSSSRHRDRDHRDSKYLKSSRQRGKNPASYLFCVLYYFP